MIIRGLDNEILEWASHRLRAKLSQPATAFGIANRNGDIIGAAIWNAYEGKNVELTCVGKGAFRKDVCRELARYAFDELGCERISLTVKDPKVANLAKKYGWKVEGRKRRYYGTADAVMMGMLKDECPFLRKES